MHSDNDAVLNLDWATTSQNILSGLSRRAARVNESMNASIHEPTNQPTNQSTNQSTHESIHGLPGDMTHWTHLRADLKALINSLASLKMPSASVHEPYGRKILYASPECEVMLACWKPQATCAPHDHGFATGAVLILAGEFEEVSYHWRGRGDVQANSESVRTAASGDVLEVEGSHFHSMTNLHGEGLTLHIYTPAISGMKVLDLQNQRTLVVADDCGAWVPQDEAKIKESWPWTPTKIG